MITPPARLSLRSWVSLGVILALGAGLRLSGVSAGAPSRMGVDEPVILEITHRMLTTGDFHPHFFDYGSLTFYLHTLVSAVAFLAGASDRRWSSLSQLWMGDLLVPTRTVTALLGVATVLVVFFIARRWSHRAGLVAAATMAILPPHVRESHFTLTDTPLTLGLSLVLLLSIRATERQTRWAIALAGLVVGLTAAIKYNGGLGLVMPLAAVAWYPRGHRASAALLAVGASALAFLVGQPYTLLDLPAFLNGFGRLLQAYSGSRTTLEAASIYLSHLRNWFSLPGYIVQVGYLSLAVIAFGAWRSRTLRAPATLVVGFALLYFLFVSRQGSLLFGRYLLPMAPMLAVMMGIGITSLAEGLARRVPRFSTAALPLTASLVLVLPLTGAVLWNLEHRKPSTLDQVGRFLVGRVGPGERVVMEGTAVQAPPRVAIRRVPELVGMPLERYRADGITYLIASSENSDAYLRDPVGRARQKEALEALMAQTEVVQVFTPNASRTGPTLTILRLVR